MEKTSKKKVYAETENIDNIMSEMTDKCDEITKMLDESLDKVNDTKRVFDTPTSAYFRSKAEEYIEEEKLYINNSVLPVIESLSVLSKMYQEEYENEQAIIKKEQEGGSV